MGFMNERQENVPSKGRKDRGSLYSPTSSQKLGAMRRPLGVKSQTPPFGMRPYVLGARTLAGNQDWWTPPDASYHSRVYWTTDTFLVAAVETAVRIRLTSKAHKSCPMDLKSRRPWIHSFPQSRHLGEKATFHSPAQQKVRS